MAISTTETQAKELALIDVCLEIGDIAGSNCHYTAGLNRRIEQTGKSVEQLTVAELLQLHREFNTQFNAIYGGES
ncbi:hypothetical protein Q9L42_017290 [Methylomarinum sp. Ch1-1]|uniref:Uncharacterized protein n=1 Tax=Methylomarinum roseum TaxID=3067653 RepID=A0AAU7NT14_9GAMM|nr:hypothetical protein [Methylomarinum sp. Ch1-1]MDP4519910.1 hypothetical protein [Methylomarinum sp. Ch1-1]